MKFRDPVDIAKAAVRFAVQSEFPRAPELLDYAAPLLVAVSRKRSYRDD